MQPRETPKFLALSVPLSLQAAAGNGLPRFDLVAYTGGVIKPYGWWDGVIVDLAGLEIQSQQLPIRYGHRAEWASGVGHTESVSVANGQLTASGVISRDTLAAKEVVKAAQNGFPWQASIGADPLEVEFLREGVTTTINGQKVTGPLDIVRRARLYEISIVDLGADPDTEVTIAAQRGATQGAISMAIPNSTPNAGQSADNPTPAPAPVQASAPAAVPVAQPVDTAVILAQHREQLANETQRVNDVRRICAGRHGAIEEQAIREGWTSDQTELAVLRASRPAPAVIVAGNTVVPTARLLECALAQSTNRPDLERAFDAQTLQAAHDRWRSRMSLQELLLEAAWANGYTGRSFRQDVRGVLQAAFSSADVAGIMSNNANKFLLAGFTGVEQTFRRVSAKRSVTDFKTVSSYRLVGAEEYQLVGPGGEIKHGDLGELSYSNRADTYALILAVTRQDLINDDLGALSDIPRKLGRGAGIKLNKVFWTKFLANSNFFKTANSNYIEGATAGETTDSRLNADGLTRARNTFRKQTTTEGDPVGLQPKLLLVPSALENAAWALTRSEELRDTTANTKAPTGNPHAGKYEPVLSDYLDNSGYTGHSAKAWYLLADPMDLPVIEVAYLNGQESPTIESADADFNTLGIQFRGYHDFGVELQEYRGGVKAKGEA